jgi:uncharacterized protein (TIGR03067 family)
MSIVLDRDQARKVAAPRDIARLQGQWHYFAGGRRASLLIEDNSFTITFHNGDHYSGTFEVDPLAKPPAMDLEIAQGPPQHEGKRVLAIYQIDGQHLIWAPSPPGNLGRLGAFPPKDDPNHLCIVFRQ